MPTRQSRTLSSLSYPTQRISCSMTARGNWSRLLRSFSLHLKNACLSAPSQPATTPARRDENHEAPILPAAILRDAAIRPQDEVRDCRTGRNSTGDIFLPSHVVF